MRMLVSRLIGFHICSVKASETLFETISTHRKVLWRPVVSKNGTSYILTLVEAIQGGNLKTAWLTESLGGLCQDAIRENSMECLLLPYMV